MAGLWTWGIDYQNQPLIDAYWTPGWTSQNDKYVQVPANQFSASGFPSGLIYVNVIGNYFDSSADPLSGYLTFWPSSDLTFNVNGNITYIPQRYAGTNQTSLGVNQMGTGNIYLWKGQLSVSLLSTDNINMNPSSFTYHVTENYFEGLQYDIVAPSVNSSVPVDIHNLIIPGTVRPVNEEFEQVTEACFLRIPVVSTQYVVVDISDMVSGFSFNPTQYQVNFAFISGANEPQLSDWKSGQWATKSSPFLAQILEGPSSSVTLSQGLYKVWVQVIAPPQTSVMQAGTLEIY